jgi:mRNA interferase HigB
MHISRFDRLTALEARVTKKHPKQGATLAARIRAFRETVKAAAWKNAIDVKKDFGATDPVGGNRVVFDLCGNSYRIVAAINYQIGVVDIRFAGTHEEYDKIDAKSV